MGSRRKFLTGLLVAGAATSLKNSSAAAQLPGSVATQRAQGGIRDPRQQPDATPDSPNAQSPEKRTLEANEKEIKNKVDRLYELATDLKAEVDKTDTSKVFSTTLLKKATEIEKLAKDIRTRARG